MKNLIKGFIVLALMVVAFSCAPKQETKVENSDSTATVQVDSTLVDTTSVTK